MVRVPFTLSLAPSEGWTQYFNSNAPIDAEAKIKGDRASQMSQRQRDNKRRMPEQGAKLVEAANLHCREIDAEQQRMQAKEQEERRRKEQEQKRF